MVIIARTVHIQAAFAGKTFPMRNENIDTPFREYKLGKNYLQREIGYFYHGSILEAALPVWCRTPQKRKMRIHTISASPKETSIPKFPGLRAIYPPAFPSDIIRQWLKMTDSSRLQLRVSGGFRTSDFSSRTLVRGRHPTSFEVYRRMI